MALARCRSATTISARRRRSCTCSAGCTWAAPHSCTTASTQARRLARVCFTSRASTRRAHGTTPPSASCAPRTCCARRPMRTRPLRASSASRCLSGSASQSTSTRSAGWSSSWSARAGGCRSLHTRRRRSQTPLRRCASTTRTTRRSTRRRRAQRATGRSLARCAT